MSTSWNDTLKPGDKIKAEHIETLRAAIRTEIIGRRRLGSFSPTDTTVTGGTRDKAVHTQELIDQMSKVSPQGVTAVKGDLIRASTLTLLRVNLNRYEQAPSYGSGESGCNAGCTGVCTSCTGTCTGGCTSCTNCSGCSGCGSGCATGCSGCSGCSGCGSGCASSCSGCSGTCTGGCDAACADCSGTCQGGCSTGCTVSCYGICDGSCGNNCLGSCQARAS